MTCKPFTPREAKEILTQCELLRQDIYRLEEIARECLLRLADDGLDGEIDHFRH